jgi:hypothetical protein
VSGIHAQAPLAGLQHACAEYDASQAEEQGLLRRDTRREMTIFYEFIQM